MKRTFRTGCFSPRPPAIVDTKLVPRQDEREVEGPRFAFIRTFVPALVCDRFVAVCCCLLLLVPCHHRPLFPVEWGARRLLDVKIFFFARACSGASFEKRGLEETVARAIT